jgi:hypothetical protein
MWKEEVVAYFKILAFRVLKAVYGETETSVTDIETST